MALADMAAAVDLGDAAVLAQDRVISAQAHGAAEIAARLPLLERVAAHPFGHEADDGVLAGSEFGRARALEPRQIARRFDHRHLHAEADAEIRDAPLAGKARCFDLALGTPFAEAARDENAVDGFKPLHRAVLLEDLAVEPIEPHLHMVGDAAMGERLGERFVTVEEMRV